jgi:hypothetical protein
MLHDVTQKINIPYSHPYENLKSVILWRVDPDAKQCLRKQRPFLGKARNSRRTAFSVVRAAAVSCQTAR